MVAVDLRGQNPQQFAAMIVGKLIALGITGGRPREVAALAAPPSPLTVIWLDELQRYLDDEHGLPDLVLY